MKPTGRDLLLREVRQSLEGARLPSAAPHHPGSFRGYTYERESAPAALASRFRTALEGLGGRVHDARDAADAMRIVIEILQEAHAERVLAWSGASFGPGFECLMDRLAGAGIAVDEQTVPVDPTEREARVKELAAIPAGLTAAQAGVADLGALVVASGSGRGRLASLLPPLHVAVLRRSQIYPSLPACLPCLEAAGASSNVVLIAGPSRTADIELTLSRGVHGPKDIHVVIVDSER